MATFQKDFNIVTNRDFREKSKPSILKLGKTWYFGQCKNLQNFTFQKGQKPQKTSDLNLQQKVDLL
jgi:hypothetical protein